MTFKEVTDDQVAERKRWVKALLSGDYKQGQGALCERQGAKVGYCCLGVYTHLVDPASDRLAFEDGRAVVSRGHYLTMELREQVGINAPEEGVLASRNDGGSTFAEIAMLIAWSTHRGRSIGSAGAITDPDFDAAAWAAS